MSSEPFITSAPIETRGIHDRVRVFVRHQLAGELVVSRGDGALLQARLLFGDRNDESDPTERPTPVPPPSLVEMLRQGPILIEDVPWLCKDFAVLYRTAKRVAEACRGGGEDEGRPYPALTALEAQLQRLSPAFDQCESVRLEVPSW